MNTRTIKIDFGKSDFLICVFLAGYNFFSKFPFIVSRDLSWDEPFSAFYSQFPIPQIITEMFKGNNPPFYEIFLHVYSSIFGLSEMALRMPSLLFSCGTVAFLYYSGRRLHERWVGIFVALLFILNNLQFFYSLAARMYALFSMLVAASIYLCITCYQEPLKRKNYYLLLLINLLMCYTHYFAGFVILAQFLAWLVTYRNRDFFRNIFFVFVYNSILVLPMLFVFKLRAEGFVNAFEFKPPYPEIWKNIIMNLVNGMDVYNSAYTFLAIGVIIFAISLTYQKVYSFKNSYYFVLLFILFALPLSLTWYFGNTYPLFIDRYYLYATIPLFLFFALCIASFYRPIGNFWIAIFFLYLLNMYSKNFTKLDNDYMLRNWSGATLKAKQLQQESPNTIILIDPLWADLGFSYYYNRELFNTGNKYNQALEVKKIYRIWSGDSLNKILNSNEGSDVILYCDENTKVDSTNNGHYRLLQRRGYIKDSAFFYPLCTTVIKFHPTDSTTSK